MARGQRAEGDQAIIAAVVLTFAAVLERDADGRWLVSFPAFSEAHTFGETKRDAADNAADALATIVQAYVKDGQPLPTVAHVSSSRVVLDASVRRTTGFAASVKRVLSKRRGLIKKLANR